MSRPTIAAIILCRNNPDHIEAAIESVRWADSIIVFDSFSTDNTPDLARAAGAQVIQHVFENWSLQREAALAAASADWVFFLDHDERATPALAAEMRAAVESTDYAGYWVPRHNYIFGILTKYAGWYPDYQLRLMRRAAAHYDLSRAVHELVVLDGEAGHLQNPLIHYNYTTIQQFRAKQDKYTAFAAGEMFKNGVRVKPQNYILQPIRHFRWRYVELGGWRGGWHGFRLSLIMAYYEWVKYRLLAGLWRAKP